MLDLVLTLCALLVLALPLAVVSLLVRVRLGPPIFFRAVRAGRWGKPFILYKFRTMHNWKDENGEFLPDEERITELGRFLRRTSIDELPQLINVLRGEMSLVGPRPLLLEYVDRYTPHQARRLEVRPGITGWAQINGRNGMSWEEKFNHDVWYVNQMNTLLDLKIMAKTALQVVRRESVDGSGDLSVPVFMGSTKVTQTNKEVTLVNLEQEIRAFIADNFLLTRSIDEVAGNESLTRRGIVDSVGVLEVILFLETNYGIEVLDTEVVSANVDTIDNIVAYVSRKLKLAEAVGPAGTDNAANSANPANKATPATPAHQATPDKPTTPANQADPAGPAQGAAARSVRIV